MTSEKKINRICVYGIGGVGGYFGGLLAHAIFGQPDAGREIYFIGRGAHLQEIKKNGLLLNTSEQTGLVCKPAKVVENMEGLPVCDLIFLTVKSYDLEQTVKLISKYTHKDTMIIPLLNGVDIYHRVRSVLETGIVFPSCVYIFSSIERPGVVTQKGPAGRIIFGKDPKRPDIIPQNIIDLFKNAGINHQWMENAFPAIWEKYLFIAPFALVTARYNATFGEVLKSPELKETTQRIMNELVAIAEYEDILFDEGSIAKTLEKAATFPPESKTSYQRDLEQKGKKNEGDLFGGAIIRLGKKYGVKTPVTEELYASLQQRP
jgi:2-dehydropantoate 2-reductase